MKDHIIREATIEDICPYCTRKVDRHWEADFSIHSHYRTVTCDCGKKLSVKTDIISSGDGWEKRADRKINILPIGSERNDGVHTLENRMKIVKEYEWKFETRKNG